jgi:hypothetical protein
MALGGGPGCQYPLGSLHRAGALGGGSRGAIPVAWTVVRAQAKGAWAPHWKALLAALHASVPTGWMGLVLADRGLYARWLFEAIQHQGWHPYLGVNAGGTYRPATGGGRSPPPQCGPQAGRALVWGGGVFSGTQGEIGLYLGRLLGTGASGALAGADRPGAGAGTGSLVWTERLD